MAVCHFVDLYDGKMPRKEIAKQFDISESHLSHIVERHWKTYINEKNKTS